MTQSGLNGVRGLLLSATPRPARGLKVLGFV